MPAPARPKLFKLVRRGVLLSGFLVALSFMLVFAPGLQAASDYSFEVPKEDVYVIVNQDSSINFKYEVEFKNDKDGKPIDVIDMGMPTANYNLGECSASINDNPLTDIRASTVVSPGVEVHLGQYAIQPGDSGVFKFKGRNAQMVFQDTEHEGYASVEFMNTWWGEKYAHGKTDLTVSFQFPPGVQPNETVYHGEKYSFYSDAGGAHVFTWEHSEAKPSEGVLHGISFPAVYVAGVYPKQPTPDYRPVTSTSYDSGYNSDASFIFKIFAPILFVLIPVISRFIFSAARVKGKGAKVKYIAPTMSIEGAGPKTDLDAAEAAVLMNQELDRVTAVVFLGLIQKGLVNLTGRKPARFHKTSNPPNDLPPHYYEFLAAVSPNGSLDKSTLKMALTMLIKRVEKKTKGFCHEDTAKYYEDLAKNSWIGVKSMADRGEKLSEFNELLPYLLLDPAFNSKVRDTFSTGTYTVPLWISSLAALGDEGPAVDQVQGGQVGAIEGSKVAEAVATAFLSVQDCAYPQVEDMEKEIVREVNPKEYDRVYVRQRYYGTGGGGGGGCACACACAGCACACAGGGR